MWVPKVRGRFLNNSWFRHFPNIHGTLRLITKLLYTGLVLSFFSFLLRRFLAVKLQLYRECTSRIEYIYLT